MSETDVLLGKNIRTYRRASRMTLEQLAEQINKSKATVGKYEQGAIAMDVDTLCEIADALGLRPAQLLTALQEPKSPPVRLPISEEAYRKHLYLYDGRRNSIVRSLLVGSEDEALTLFYDLPSFDAPQKCRALYYGRRQRHDFVTNYLMENQSNGVEHVFICIMRSLDRPGRGTGLLSGISSRMLLPASAKCILSDTALNENKELIDSLLLTKEDMRLTRRYNMFIVEQTGMWP